MVSDQELVDNYGKFCGFMAWKFVRKSHQTNEDNNLNLTQEDAEDFASTALYYLVRMPQKYRDQPYYVRQVIISKIITAWHKRRKQLAAEWQAPRRAEKEIVYGAWQGTWGTSETDYFETLPGRDGLAEYTQVNKDCGVMLNFIPKLHTPERLVLELHFGLNGCQPCGPARIGKKLGRSNDWVETRLKWGLAHLKQLMTAKPQIQPV